MAKLTMPLGSFDARGTLADAVTYSYWKGRNYARVRVIPKNPKSEDQAEIRTYLGAVGKNNSMIQSKEKPGVLLTQIMEKTPADQSWMSFFVKAQIGNACASISAAIAEYATLEAATQTLWETGAALVPLTGFDLGYGTVTPITGAEQLYVSAKAAYALGLAIADSDPKDWVEADITAFANAYKAAV